MAKGGYSFGDIVLLKQHNVYQDWIMWDLAQRKGYLYTKVTVDNTYRSLANYHYNNLLVKQEMIVLVLDENCATDKLVAAIKGLSRSHRIYIIDWQTGRQLKALKSLATSMSVKELPKVEDYEDRENVIRNLLKQWEVKFDKSTTRELLIRLMVMDETSWTTVKQIAELYSTSEQVMTTDTLNDLFPNLDFYNLDKYLLQVLKGKTKWKLYKELHYFLKVKEYSASWLVKKLQERVNTLSIVYTLYRQGILLDPISKELLAQRLELLPSLNTKEVLDSLNPYHQEQYLDFVKSVPYADFEKVTKVVYDVPKWIKPVDLYEVIANTRKIYEERQQLTTETKETAK